MASHSRTRPAIPCRTSAGRRQILSRGFSLVAATLSAPALATPAHATPPVATPVVATPIGAGSDWPTRPIVLVVPWPAGGPTDLTMRVLARIAARELGVPMVVENRPGAGGAIGVGTMLAAVADGHTIMQLPITVYRLPYLQKLPWDPARDLAPVLQVSEVTFGIVVGPDSPLHSIADLFAHARAHKGLLTVGSTGHASTPHLVMADLFEREGIDYIHVPFKGAADQLFAVQAATIMVGVVGSGYAPLVDEGRLRLLATFNAERSPRWPEVPTMRELGHDIVARSPYGIAAPRGVPDAIISRLHAAFRTATLDPEHVAELKRYDQEVAYLDTADFRQVLEQTVALERRWARLIGRP